MILSPPLWATGAWVNDAWADGTWATDVAPSVDATADVTLVVHASAQEFIVPVEASEASIR